MFSRSTRCTHFFFVQHFFAFKIRTFFWLRSRFNILANWDNLFEFATFREIYRMIANVGPLFSKCSTRSDKFDKFNHLVFKFVKCWLMVCQVFSLQGVMVWKTVLFNPYLQRKRGDAMWSIFPDIVRSSLLAERPPAGASSILSTTFSSSPVLKDFRSPAFPFAKADVFFGEAAFSSFAAAAGSFFALP